MKKHTFYFLVLIVLIILTGFLASCESKARRELDKIKWEEFLKCSENEGDWGCDSCYKKVFGYYPESTGYLKYNPAKN